MSGSESTAYERELLRNIEEFGWQATSVFDPDGEDPGFTYSIGFTSSVASPEFIVFGLDPDLMHAMLGQVFRQLKDGKAATDGSHWTDILDGVDCVARAVHPDNIRREYLSSAIWFWNQSEPEGVPPVLQLVWPGKLDGLFPWDEGCDQLVRDLQPELYLPRSQD